VHVPSSPAYHHGRQAVAPTACASRLPNPSPGHTANPPAAYGTPTPSPFCCPISPTRPENTTLPAHVLIQSPTVSNDPRRSVPERTAAQFNDVLSLIAPRRGIKCYSLWCDDSCTQGGTKVAIYSTFFLSEPRELPSGFPGWKLPLPEPVTRKSVNPFTREEMTITTRSTRAAGNGGQGIDT